jgi:2-polyprenyl-3-methyl-5-hydroxy-6-metoxy-1,4-benzoquinol methylase
MDLVHDATTPLDMFITDEGKAALYQTVICCETLEHIDDIQAAVTNAAAVMAPGGLWISTIPFIFGEHNYPSDYWRVTRSGMEYLLRKAGLVEIQTEYAAGCTHVYATARKP